MACWPRARRDLWRLCETLCVLAPEWLLAELWRKDAANAGGTSRAAEIRSANPRRNEDILTPPELIEDFKNSS
jgi:hypothetical protein